MIAFSLIGLSEKKFQSLMKKINKLNDRNWFSYNYNRLHRLLTESQYYELVNVFLGKFGERKDYPETRWKGYEYAG